jgi:hypothetical protein
MYLVSQFETMMFGPISSQKYLKHDVPLLSLIGPSPPINQPGPEASHAVKLVF